MGSVGILHSIVPFVPVIAEGREIMRGVGGKGTRIIGITLYNLLMFVYLPVRNLEPGDAEV